MICLLYTSGLHFPIYVSQSTWHIIIFVYILIASVVPVWALLQPRDYLNSYLLVFMILAAIVGVFAVSYTHLDVYKRQERLYLRAR